MRIIKKYLNPIGLALWLLLIAVILSIPFMSLTLDKELNVSFLNHEGNDTALVFFGFRGCSDICPMTLSIFRQLFDTPTNISKLPQVFFVDIDTQSNANEALNFAKKFHSSFIGLHISSKELIEFSGKFGLNIKQQGNKISHLGKTYLLRRKENEWRLLKVYNPNSFSVQTLKKELFHVDY